MKRKRRQHTFEQLEDRRLLTIAGWHNFLAPQNVNGDSVVSPLDVLIIVNELNGPRYEDGKLPIPGPVESTTRGLDVSCDGYVSPLDALIVINALNAERYATGWTFDTGGGYIQPEQNGNGSCSPRLVEGNSLVSELAMDFSVPDFPASLKLDFENLEFDASDTGFIRDAFEFAIVDDDGNSLSHPFQVGRDAVYNVTEGVGASAGSGVVLHGDSLFVSLTHLPSNLAGRAIVRMVNDDADTTSAITVHALSVVPQDTALALAPTGSSFPASSPLEFAPRTSALRLAPVSPGPSTAAAARSQAFPPVPSDAAFAQDALGSGEAATTVELLIDQYSILPNSNNVLATPSVFDLNGDGIPEIIYATYTGSNRTNVLRALSGNGEELWSVTQDDGVRANWAGGTAVGDIDNDGLPEIIVIETTGVFGHNGDAPRLVALENDGSLKWRSSNIWGGAGSGAPAIADIDADGHAEIVIGASVLNGADGSLRWQGNAQGGTGRGSAGFGPLSIVADIDLDGQQEILAGKTAYDTDGSVLWELAGPDGFNAVGNFDDDLFPEIVFVSNGTARIVNHDGSEFLAPVAIPGGGRGGAPTVADFDNDGEPEFAVAGKARYVVFEKDGTILWEAETQDGSSNITGSSVFDFDGDGSAEVVYGDERYLRIYRGYDGEVLYAFERSSSTGHELPVVADVDGDGATELVFGAGFDSRFPTQGVVSGLIVLGNPDWVATRPIWNQHSYHITNINDDGSIPVQELNSWEIYNNYRRNLQPTGIQLGLPTIQVNATHATVASGTTVLLTGQATADGIRASGVPNAIDTVAINDQFVDVFDSSGRFFTSVDIRPGVNAFEFSATDSVGQTARVTVTIVGTQTSSEFELSQFADTTATFTGVYGRTSFDASTDQLLVDLATRNDGTFVSDVPLLIKVRNLSNPRVSVVNADGILPDGTPFYDYTSAVAGGRLAPDETTAAPTIAFHTPSHEQFDYDLVFFGKLNSHPEITSAPVVDAYLGRDYEYAVSATDRDGDTLTFALVSAPTSMRIDSASGQISWQPTVGDSGVHDVVVRLRDGRGGEAFQRFAIAVNETPPNRPPLVTSHPQTVAQIASRNVIRETPLTLEPNYVYDLSAFDPDGDELTYVLDTSPAGMTIDASSGLVAWAPSAEQTGNHDVVIIVSDGRGGAVEQSYVVCVHAEVEPADGFPNSSPVITSQPREYAIAGETYSYRISAQDADLDELSYTLGVGPAGASIELIERRNENGAVTDRFYELSWPVPRELGGASQSFVLSVRDSQGATATQAWGMMVANSQPTNSPPRIDNTSVATVKLGLPWSYQVEAEDVDSDSLTYSLINAPEGMSISTLGLISWTPPTDMVANAQFTVRVSDGSGAAVSTWDLPIQPFDGNSRPAITSLPPIAAISGELYSYDPSSRDPENDPLIWSLVASPRGMSIDPQTGKIRWQPDEQQFGLHLVSLAATDPFRGQATQSFEVHVSCHNLAPIIVSIPRTVALTRRGYLYAPRAEDFEGDTLHWSLPVAPQGMTINAKTGLIHWTPSAGQLGEHNVELEVSDGISNPARQSFKIVVRSADELVDPADPSKGTQGNRAPVIVSTPLFSAEAGLDYQYSVIAVDPDGDAIAYEIAGNPPTGLSIDAQRGLLTWATTLADVGEHAISIRASDVFGASAAQGFLLTVRENLAPEIASTPSTNVTSGALFRYSLQVLDPEDDPITFQLSEAPDGMTIDRYGRILWQTTAGDLTPRNVTAIVTDDRGGIDSQSWTITPVADTVAPIVNLNIIVGDRFYDSNARVDINQDYSVRVLVADNVGVAGFGLEIDGEQVPLDQRGRFSLRASELAVRRLRAFATDVNGNESEVLGTVTIGDPSIPNAPVPGPGLPNHPGFDPNDNQRPIVEIHSPEPAAVLSNRVSIIGTVDDPEDNLWYYRVYFARLGTVDFSALDLKDPNWTILRESTEEVINGELAVFDPSRLPNDAYAVVLAGFDVNGRGYLQPTVYTVEGNVNIGNFRFDVPDLSIPVAGIPIQVTRVYDTQDVAREGDFGQGWSLGVQDANILETIPAGYEFVPGQTKVYLTTPEGRRVGFTYEEEILPLFCFSPNNCLYVGLFGDMLFKPVFRPDPGVYETLEIDLQEVARGGLSDIFGAVGKALNGGLLVNPDFYTLTTKDGLKYRYHQNRGLETITDLNGNVATFSENGISHTSGQSVQFVRDHRGRIQQIIDPAGNAIAYEYNAIGDLVSVTNQVGLRTRYEYLTEPIHYLDAAFDASDKRILKTVYEQDADSGQYDFKGVIDAAGNRVDERDFDTDANTGVVRDGNGNATTLIYDDRGNVLEEIDSLGNKTIREYADPKNPDLETRIVDRNGDIVERAYDARGNLLKITEYTNSNPPSTIETSFTYDGGNRVTSITNGLDRTTEFAYDARGNLETITNAVGDSSRFTYDSQGRRASFIDFNGNTTQFDYTAACPCGSPSQATYADGTYQTFEYNSFGQVTREQTFEADGTLVGRRTTVYDAAGRTLAELAGVGGDPAHPQTTVYRAYDGNLLDWEAIVNPASLDESGNFLESPVTPIADRKSRITDYEYDVNDRVIRQVDAEGGVVEFRYDANGNRVLLQDPVGNITTWLYDGLNRVIEERDPLYNQGLTIDQALAELSVPSGADLASNVGAEHVRAFAYDGEGNQIEMIDRNGRRREFHYDQAGRLLSEDWYNADASFERTVSFTYDVLGNMLTASDPDSNYLFTYDTLNRLQSVDNNPDGSREVPRVLLTYAYDAQGNVTRTRDDAGVTVESEYDVRNRLSIRKWYDADIPDGQAADVDPARVDFLYNAMGRESEIRRYSDLAANTLVGRTVRTYYLAGRSDELIHSDAVDALIAGYDYDYDFAGLLLHESRSHQTAEYAQEIDYSYDLTGQLTDALFSGQDDEHYVYDANGNRITSLVGPSDNPTDQRTYTTGPANQLDSDGIYRYEYDGEGNQVKRVHLTTGETRILIYDHHNRLIRVDDWTSNPGDPNSPVAGAVITQTVEYTYDALGRRIARTADLDGVGPQAAETEFYIYNGDNVWADFDGSSEVVARYLFGDRIDQNLARIRPSEETVWYLGDKLGTIRDLLESNGNLSTHLEYGAFGHPVPKILNYSVDRFTFTGREFDQVLGAHYYRARMFDPSGGTFLSRDPLSFEAGDVNLSRYVGNLPTSLVDPTGNVSIGEYALTAAFFSGLASAANSFFVDQPGDLGQAGIAGLRGAAIGGAVALVFVNLGVVSLAYATYTEIVISNLAVGASDVLLNILVAEMRPQLQQLPYWWVTDELVRAILLNVFFG